jgi:hypothetical protein
MIIKLFHTEIEDALTTSNTFISNYKQHNIEVEDYIYVVEKGFLLIFVI